MKHLFMIDNVGCGACGEMGSRHFLLTLSQNIRGRPSGRSQKSEWRSFPQTLLLRKTRPNLILISHTITQMKFPVEPNLTFSSAKI